MSKGINNGSFPKYCCFWTRIKERIVEYMQYFIGKRGKELLSLCVSHVQYETEWLALEPFQNHNPYENNLNNSSLSAKGS